MGLIYKITNPNQKLYVGQTEQTAHERITQHKSIRKEQRCSAIQRSIRKYGWNAHLFEIIEDNVLKEFLDDREIYWIKELNTYAFDNQKGGLNLTRGGKCGGTPWKWDKKRVKKARSRKGENAPSWGRKWPEEMKRQIAEGVSRYNKAHGTRPSEECHRKAKQAQYIPIVAYDSQGNFISEYPFIRAAATALGLDRKCVVDVVNGRQKHSKGFFFRKKENGYPMKIDVSDVKIQLKRRPIFCLSGEDVVEFENPKQAAQVLGLWHQTIKDAANLNKPLRNGLRFVYKDDFSNQNRPHIVGPYLA